MRARDYIVIPLLLAFGGLCLWHGLVPNATATSQSQPIVQVSVRPSEPIETAIENIKVGQRVVGQNPLREQVETWVPDSDSWKELHLHMRKQSGASLWITLIRPDWWVQSKDARVGETIELELPEMGALGPAEVTHLGPCPPVSKSSRVDAPVVTGTFKHEVDEDSNVISLRLEGQSEPTGVTDNHPYWSVDRQEFVPAGELRVGETVNTANGTTRVASVEVLAYTGFLYNLETTEHVYRVGSAGTLVHNSCARGRAPEFNGGQVNESQFLDSAEQYLGPGYREPSPGRFVSGDGMRQVRFGAHETRGPDLHGHFEAFDRPDFHGGRIIENTRVDIIPD